MLWLRALIAVICLTGPAAAWAHAGDEGGQPGWTFAPWVTVPLCLLLLIFLVGCSRLASRSKIERRRSWLFLAGWGALAFALVSPLHQGGERSFTLHMAEHELIMLVAMLLLAASNAGGELAWGLPAPLRRRLGGSWKAPLSLLWRRVAEPVTATVFQAVVMWVWHAPALFDRAIRSDAWHAAQHISFVAASLVFWVAMLNPRRGGYLLSSACLFLTSLVEGALGALMSLSQSPWYSAYAGLGMSGIGLSPVADQQLAGLLMWIPGGLVHGAAALVLLHRWLTANEDRHALPAD